MNMSHPGFWELRESSPGKAYKRRGIIYLCTKPEINRIRCGHSFSQRYGQLANL